ncbi:MAG: hypothetical protein KA053_03650 [Lentimicrobiaceae bacterium]|nr:hypothetical protein [Lentimicrobiaceae bacterium]
MIFARTFVMALVCLMLSMPEVVLGQCCAGGSGSPVAGGTSQGVLGASQLQINANFQYIRSHRFFSGSKASQEKYFDRFESAYQYYRFAYGASSQFTMSVELGHYLFKKETGLNQDPDRTYTSKGIADLILFPRYTIWKAQNQRHETTVTLGLGLKLPLGSYNDSTSRVEPFSGQVFHVPNPQAVQVTSGAQDFLFYGFLQRKYTRGFSLYSSMLYVRKGWNPLGERMGDFATLSLFAVKEINTYMGINLQLRGETMRTMKVNPVIETLSFLNYDPAATGYSKVFISPQLNIDLNRFAFYFLADIPVYQHVKKTQIGTGLQIMSGFSYNLPIKKSAQNVIIPSLSIH